MALLPATAWGLLVFALQAAASPTAPAAAVMPDTCPRLVVAYSPGLVPDMSASGVVAAVWDSGVIVRALSLQRPGHAHVIGTIAASQVAALLAAAKDSPIWQGDNALYPDGSGYTLSFVRRDGSRIGRMVMTGTRLEPAMADLNRRLFAFPLSSAHRIEGRADETRWRCPGTVWQ